MADSRVAFPGQLGCRSLDKAAGMLRMSISLDCAGKMTAGCLERELQLVQVQVRGIVEKTEPEDVAGKMTEATLTNCVCFVYLFERLGQQAQ